MQIHTLAESCLVIDVLGDEARDRLITWYCNLQLKEYRNVFRGNEEAGGLDNSSRRYAWLRRILGTYDEEHAQIFPLHWKVNEALCKAFCDTTRYFLGVEVILGRITEGFWRGAGRDWMLNCY